MSFNTFGTKKRTYGGNTPVWLGPVRPMPFGGVLASGYLKDGVVIPAGTPVKFDSGTITPLLAFEVVAYTAPTGQDADGILQIKPCLGHVPTTSDFIMKLGNSFSSTGKASAISEVAENATTAGTYDLTVTHANLDTCAVGDICVLSSAVAGGSTKSVKIVPNGYLYNDICANGIDLSEENAAATGAVVNFHGGGLLIARNPIGSAIADKLQVQIPNVILIKGV